LFFIDFKDFPALQRAPVYYKSFKNPQEWVQEAGVLMQSTQMIKKNTDIFRRRFCNGPLS